MSRLSSELQRLYLGDSDTRSPASTEPSGGVRVMVMELARPPSWESLSKVWHGVQADLELPAPAIAVSGIDGIQLWFSLELPIAPAQAQVFLESLRSRFLPDIKSDRIRLTPASGEARVPPLPPRLEHTGNWSAFVAADLAPVFGDTPWLDIPPNEEGQAALLRGLQPMKPAVFEVAMRQLGQGAHQPAAAAQQPAGAQPAGPAADDDPKRFLLRIMNDDSVAMALRIEAAKALLQYASDQRQQPGG